MITATSTVVVSQNQVSSELNGEAVILNMQDGVYYGLDEVALVIWNAIQRPTTIAQICEVVRAEYEVSEAECAHSVVALLEHLHSVGLVEVQHAATA